MKNTEKWLFPGCESGALPVSRVFTLSYPKVVRDDEESTSSSAVTVVTATPSAATTSALRRGNVRDRQSGSGFPSNLSSITAGAIEVAENQVTFLLEMQQHHPSVRWLIKLVSPPKKWCISGRNKLEFQMSQLVLNFYAHFQFGKSPSLNRISIISQPNAATTENAAGSLTAPTVSQRVRKLSGNLFSRKKESGQESYPRISQQKFSNFLIGLEIVVALGQIQRNQNTRFKL